MIKLADIKSEDIEYICKQIPLQHARHYFQKNQKSFTEIKPGFRPEKLSATETNSLLVKNINRPFISSFLEKTIDVWLNQIQENLRRLADEGYSEGEALLLTIPKSVFCDNCGLYFVLIGQDPGEDYICLFREALSLRQKEDDARTIKAQEEQAQREEELLKDAKKTINELQEQLRESRNTVTIISKAREEQAQKEDEVLKDAKKTITGLQGQLREIEKAKSSLSEELLVANSLIANQNIELEALKRNIQDDNVIRSEMQAELEHYRRLASFSDEYVPEDISENPYVSIGQICLDYNGKRWINRLADIINGEIVPFAVDDRVPRLYSNRDRLYWYDGPEEENAFGVWSWRADPNAFDPNKDFIKSSYKRSSKCIEVIEFPQCRSLLDIAGIITDWFEKRFSGEKVLFVYTTTNGLMEGLLCPDGSMEFNENKARLLASVFMLPHYTIKPSDILNIGGLFIYRKMSLGIPQSIYRVRAPYDVVKKMILSRVTIPALRENELTKKEAQKCKHFLESIPTETLIQELSDAYACTEAEAKGYIDGFIEHAETYISKNDFDVNTLSLALARNAELVELCKDRLTEEWERENSDKTAEAEERLETIEEAEKEIRETIKALSREKKELDDEIVQVKKEIEDANRLAISVEEKVADRIKNAQQDAAEFVSQMAFFTPYINSGKTSEIDQQQNSLSVFKSSMNHSDKEPVDDLESFEEELTENIMAIGYSDESAVDMAQAISFCICSRLPIVIGENATILAQCLAATIGGEELTEVFLGNHLSVIDNLYEIMNGVHSEYPLVYLFHGAFDGYGINLFNEISNLICKPAINAVVIFSLQGVSPNMIIDSVWSRAFYIDGDYGIERIADGLVHALDPVMKFNQEIDEDEFNVRQKELKHFSSVLKNMQICRYARYLAFYDVGIKDSPTIISQIIAVSRSVGSEEALSELFHENGISIGEKMLEQYL